MFPARKFNVFHALCGVLVLAASLAAAPVVQAECQPGQMQEANLAYQSAAEFLNAQQWDQAIARMQSIVDSVRENEKPDLVVISPNSPEAKQAKAYRQMAEHMLAQLDEGVIELRLDTARVGLETGAVPMALELSDVYFEADVREARPQLWVGTSAAGLGRASGSAHHSTRHPTRPRTDSLRPAP